MIKVICPRCANTHFSDEVHEGKFLKCAKCGDAVQIGAKSENQIEAFEANANVHPKPIAQGFGLKLRERVFKGKRLAWMYIILVAAVMLFIWYFYPGSPDIFENASVSKKPVGMGRNGSEAAPADVAASPRPSCSPHETGEVMSAESNARGRGRLTLINGTGEDSVVHMVNDETGGVARSVYIASGATVSIDRVAIGQYSIRAAQGSCWIDGENTFAEDASYFTFPHPYRFSEETIGDEIQSDRISLTLHEVPDGNVHKEPISKAQFWATGASAR